MKNSRNSVENLMRALRKQQEPVYNITAVEPKTQKQIVLQVAIDTLCFTAGFVITFLLVLKTLVKHSKKF